MKVKIALAWPDGEVSVKVYENVEKTETLFVDVPLLLIRNESGNTAFFNMTFVVWWAQYPSGEVVDF